MVKGRAREREGGLLEFRERDLEDVVMARVEDSRLSRTFSWVRASTTAETVASWRTVAVDALRSEWSQAERTFRASFCEA